MRTAVDTNLLLDLLAGDADATSASRSAMAEALELGSLVASPVVYAELAANFPNEDEVGDFIHAFHIQVDSFSQEALFEAASAWRRYARSRGRDIQCPQCGETATVECSHCGTLLSWRQHILPDFLVGGHASKQADRLLTRDSRYYRRYFPSLTVVAP